LGAVGSAFARDGNAGYEPVAAKAAAECFGATGSTGANQRVSIPSMLGELFVTRRR
jgi:hypothetical protein